MTLLTMNRNFSPCPRFCHFGRIASPVPGPVHRAVASTCHHADAGYHRRFRRLADGDTIEPGNNPLIPMFVNFHVVCVVVRNLGTGL